MAKAKDYKPSATIESHVRVAYFIDFNDRRVLLLPFGPLRIENLRYDRGDDVSSGP